MSFFKEKLRNMKPKFKKAIAFMLCVAIILTTISVLAATDIFVKEKKYRNAYERIMDCDGFIYGTNFPYYDEKNWFGEQDICPEAYRTKPSYDEDVLTDVILNCKAMGLNSISMWMFQGYAGIEIDEVGNILGFDEYFEENLINTLKIFKQYDMTVSLVAYVHPGESAATIKNNNYYMERIMQPVVNPEVRKQYIEKLINPICDIIKDYEDVVIMFDVFSEPESTIDGRNDYAFSTDWETTWEFIRESVKAVKKKLPDMPVTCASGWGSHLSRYNDLGLDIIGTDIYSDNAIIYDPSEQTADAPVVAREFGMTDQFAANDDELHAINTTKFFSNLIDAGYAGGYIWLYNGWTTSGWSMINSNTAVNDLRTVCGTLNHFITDKIAEHRGIDTSESTIPDVPDMIGLHNPFIVQWFASRDAEKYTIEGSFDNKNWTVVADGITPDTVDSDGDNICQYTLSEIQQGKEYYYRVKVENYYGKTATSESRKYNIPLVTCSDEDNLLVNHSFETGDTTGWEGVSPSEYTEVLTAEDGTHYIHFKNGNNKWPYFNQKVDVEPNTDYVCTVIHRMDTDKASVLGRTLWRVSRGNLHLGSISDDHIFKHSDDTWIIDTITVNSGDEEFLNIMFAIGNCDGAYVDEVYFFKK